MGTGTRHKPKYLEYDPKQVQAVKDKFVFFAHERMQQRGQEDITYEIIDKTIYEYNQANNRRKKTKPKKNSNEADEFSGLNPTLISHILNLNPLKLRQPATRKEHLRKIILVLVMKQAIISLDEANEFLQLIYPDEQLREEYELDKEIYTLLEQQQQNATANIPAPALPPTNSHQPSTQTPEQDRFMTSHPDPYPYFYLLAYPHENQEVRDLINTYRDFFDRIDKLLNRWLLALKQFRSSGYKARFTFGSYNELFMLGELEEKLPNHRDKDVSRDSVGNWLLYLIEELSLYSAYPLTYSLPIWKQRFAEASVRAIGSYSEVEKYWFDFSDLEKYVAELWRSYQRAGESISEEKFRELFLKSIEYLLAVLRLGYLIQPFSPVDT